MSWLSSAVCAVIKDSGAQLGQCCFLLAEAILLGSTECHCKMAALPSDSSMCRHCGRDRSCRGALASTPPLLCRDGAALYGLWKTLEPHVATCREQRSTFGDLVASFDVQSLFRSTPAGLADDTRVLDFAQAGACPSPRFALAPRFCLENTYLTFERAFCGCSDGRCCVGHASKAYAGVS